jgi:amino acid transporter
LTDAHPALFVLRSALGDAGGRAAMALALLAMWFCGLSSITSLSRTLFAFARDGGLPTALRKVDAASNVPRNALAAASLLPFALVAVIQMSGALADTVFVAVASLATTALYVSYAIPIALGLAARRSGRWTRLGPWNLGAFGQVIAGIALLWTAVVLGVCSLPPNTAGTALLVLVILLVAVAWHTFVHRRFAGPPLDAARLLTGSSTDDS